MIGILLDLHQTDLHGSPGSDVGDIRLCQRIVNQAVFNRADSIPASFHTQHTPGALIESLKDVGSDGKTAHFGDLLIAYVKVSERLSPGA
ncbi:Uncharacterised protein [Klebsiella pneumoniae]|nr:Uncharacterised protein [Klebsiella pneumoniae]